MNAEYSIITLHLIGALIAGGAIGFERSLHGHPAGFRTHALVCLASSLLMLVALYEWKWLPGMPPGSVRTDPTRMAQGIMTGIGFLGAGVIFKEGLTIRGLTTAASIWITAGIGILMGVGFYFPAIAGTILALGILTLFQLIEDRVPLQSYAQYHVAFDRNNVMPEEEVKSILSNHGFTIANTSYRITQAGLFEYRMDIRTTSPGSASALAEELRTLETVREFRISASGS